MILIGSHDASAGGYPICLTLLLIGVRTKTTSSPHIPNSILRKAGEFNEAVQQQPIGKLLGATLTSSATGRYRSLLGAWPMM